MKYDIIFIEQLVIPTVVGVHAKERKYKQPIMLDLQLFTSFQDAITSDNIADAVDYEEIVTRLIPFVKRQDSHLLESLANNIIRFVIDNFAIEKVSLKLTKPKALRYTKQVGVMITRSRQDYKSEESF